MLLACATNLWAETYTIEFLTNTTDGTAEITSKTTVSTVVDTGTAYVTGFTTNCSKAYYKCTSGVKIGSGRANGTFEFNLADVCKSNVSKITVKSANYGSDKGTLSLSVNGTTELKSGITPGTDYVHTFTTAQEVSSIKLKTSANRAYVSSIIIETGKAATLQSIEITGEPTKTTYMTGDEFSTDGLKVMGNYDNATQKEITEGIAWTVTPATLTAGLTQVSVTATAEGKSATRTITGLTVTAPKTLASIAVSGTPAEFWKGDPFNHNGMTVTAKWDDASTTDVTAEATFSTPDMTTAGTKTITVTYKEKTTTYNITVKTIANTQETAYTVAEAIALIVAGKDLTTEVFVKGIVSEIVTPWSDEYSNITYNISDDGTTTSTQFQLFRCVTNGANVRDKVTAKGVMTKYNSTYEFTSGNTIVAIVEKVVSSIAISGEATTTNYYAGQTFDPAGLVVTATFEDALTADVTELVDWTFDPAVLEEGTTTVSVSATYKELNATPVVVTVTVGPAPKIVTIDLTKDETTTATEEKLEWKGTILTITSARTNSGNTAANNYYPGKSQSSTRFYKGNTLTFTPVKGIKLGTITYTATTDSYATAMANSTWTNATVSADGTTVTITPKDGEKAVSAKIGGTTGGKSFVINYSGEAPATAINSAAVETPAVKTIENGQLVILRDGVKYNAMGVRLQ